MKILNTNSMKMINRNKIILLVVLFMSTFSFSQKVDTVEIDGETLLVYPFKVRVNQHREYFTLLNKDALIEYYFANFLDEIKMEMGDDISYEDYKKIMAGYIKKFKKSNNDKKYINKKFIKAARKNPYALLNQSYEMNQDLTPVLDPIPDGEYIQLFDDFCLTDEKGNCQPKKMVIAGRFTIKNNVLEGKATWFNLLGEEIKSGTFENGLKTGEWRFEERRGERSLGYAQVQEYKEKGYFYVDTNIVIANYKNSALNGPYREYSSSEYPIEQGMYDFGKRVGEWIERDIIYSGYGRLKKRVRNNEMVTFRYSFASNDSLVSHKPIIRDGLISTYSNTDPNYYFYPKHALKQMPKSMFRINYTVEKNDVSEYEDEYMMSYGMDEYAEMGHEYYGEDYYYDDYSIEKSYFQTTTYDESLGKIRNRGVVIDSIGTVARFGGVYEKRYQNGQLFMRYNFVNGEMEIEDTIFWDNGNAHDVIEFMADSNKYIRSVYDYKGKLYKQLQYDSLGDFDTILFEPVANDFVYLDGFKVVDDLFSDYYFYTKNDTLKNDLSEELTIFRSWYKEDSSVLYNTVYDPINRTLKRHHYSLTGNVTEANTKTFSEDFDNWNGKDTVFMGEIALVSTRSASLYEYDFWGDTIPQQNVNYAYERFDVSSENILFKNGQAYTGEVTINFHTNKLSLSKKGFVFNLPSQSKVKPQKLKKKIAKFQKKGKGVDEFLFSYLDASDYNAQQQDQIYNAFFGSLLKESFRGGAYYGDYNEWGFEEKRVNEKKMKHPTTTTLTGYMLDGKPHGKWVAYDQFSHVMTEVPFENGEISGTVKNYSYEYPVDEDAYYYEYEMDQFSDSVPEQKVYYLSSTVEYENGMLNGASMHYNWLGETEREEYYKDDMSTGEWIERNKLAYSVSNYKDGNLDGYVKTFLTLPEQDTILLYDLNFQDGLLQGESRSFHTNGQLSKRGFFLTGEPIEDYEAFDSLGFKYHYVKFQYSYPIEEKLWEENELSVRYLFNWEDSIYFSPSDITSSESLESMLYGLGFGSDFLDRPYYGRPTLVSKKGVKYQMTKYYPNNTISRDGWLEKGKKIDCWTFFDYEGELLYEVEYFDTIITLNDSIKFKSKGILTDLDADGNVLHRSYVIEKFEKYDCSHTDHYEIRQLYTIWEANDTLGRMNGYVYNYYDNGVLQSEGQMKEGLPTGFWKYYDPFGKLNKYGAYVLGKRHGRWLSGDLSKTKYLGDICLNPNLPDLEKEIKYRENLLDITITSYQYGKSLNKQFYDVNMNRFIEVEEEDETEIEEVIELEED